MENYRASTSVRFRPVRVAGGGGEEGCATGEKSFDEKSDKEDATATRGGRGGRNREMDKEREGGLERERDR